MEVEDHWNQTVSREEWRLTMRKAFCKKDMIDDNGNLVKECVCRMELICRYFHLKKLKTWTLKEEEELIKGIQTYGVGEWERIRRDFLPDWVGILFHPFANELGNGRYSTKNMPSIWNTEY